MPRMSKKRKQEWALFLNERNRMCHNGASIFWFKNCALYRESRAGIQQEEGYPL